ncbi:MAG TPA: tRNA (N6-isopentenyl adenosine(37)-C2)-methylthiotransferase MiaB [bacterium]|nr:tRNA (N6-isopentenyl adenosine(37)-C2)-methylthiotransferase MiaB [bacterium]
MDKTPESMKKFYIRTYGCQMNEYDSAKLAALLIKHGYGKAETPEAADYIIANTCSVRKNAEDRAFAFLSTQKPLKKEGKLLCLFGCTANLYAEKNLEKHRHIDIVCGPNNYNDVPEIFRSGRKGCFTGEGKLPFIDLPPLTKNTVSAGIAVTKGCENFCSYCVVPFTRGKLLSRHPETICREIEYFVSKGITEITLLGQNVNEYGKDTGTTFAELIEKVHDISGIMRIGFTTSHPKDIPDKLISLVKNLPKLYKHIHLPMQSGSDKILKLMNRRYTIEAYKEIIRKAREAFPDITLTSDIITGYPQEEEKDFDATCRAIEDVEFDDLFVFKYSHRPGTASAAGKDSVPLHEKVRRHKIILDIQDKISYKKNIKYIGRKMDIFIRNISEKKEGFVVGRTITDKPVFIQSGPENLGRIIKVEITKAHRRYLAGFCCGENK